MYKNVGTRLPEDIVKDLEYVAEEKRSDKSRILRDLIITAIKETLIDLALEKYAKREVTLAMAARLARVPLADFMKIAADRKIPMNISVESVIKDYKSAVKLASR